jgi:ATP-dependent Clp protease ATP-binding subunit ClpB
MTSNVASEYILEHAGDDKDALCERVEEELHRVFRPEFLNRIDETIIFDALSRDDILKVLDLQLARMAKQLAEKGIRLEFSDAAKRKLAQTGYDPAFGARPLQRTVQRLIQDPLALKLLDGQIAPEDGLRADLVGDEITLERVERQATAVSR